MGYATRMTLVSASFVFASNLHAQSSTTDQGPRTYIFNVSVPVIECTYEGSIVPGAQAIQAPDGAQFVYLDERALPKRDTEAARTVVVLQFLRWDPEKEPAKFATFNANLDNQLEGLKNFCVDKTIFERTAVRTYAHGRSSWELAAGVLLLPIKMRLGGGGRSFDFSRDVTLGTVVGPRWRLSPTREVLVSILGGAGITAVTLDAASTNRAVTESTDRAAVTLTLGTMLEINRFQIGLLVGADRISNPNQADWAYQGKPWISVGLGYSLLSAPPTSPATKQ